MIQPWNIYQFKIKTANYFLDQEKAKAFLASVTPDRRGIHTSTEPLATTPGHIWRVDVLHPGFTVEDELR